MNYFAILVRLPGVILGSVVVFSIFSLVTVSFFYKLLNFSDPGVGITSRKTDISTKINSLVLLNSSKELSPLPFLPQFQLARRNALNQTTTKATPQRVGCTPKNWKSFFKLIIEPKEPDATLLDLGHVRSLCRFRERLTRHKLVDNTCGMISLIDVLQNLTGATCETVTENDLERLLVASRKCAMYYRSGLLNGKPCNSPACINIPSECFTLYNLYYYFSDDFFYDNDESSQLKRTLVMIALDGTDETAATKFYTDVFAISPHQSEGSIKVVGIESDVKNEAFFFQLFFDFAYFGFAFVLIVIIMTLYLRSFVMTIVAGVDILLSLILAFFVYVCVLQLRFFPFLNLLGGLMLIALVADDVFLFMDSLEEMKKRYPGASLEYLMTKTFHHAGMSIFVTSLTTTASFFANIVSDIPAAKCFGIYSGLCIACNFLLMCTFIPASMVLLEKSKIKKAKAKAERERENGNSSNSRCSCDPTPMYQKLACVSDFIFHVALPKIINKCYVGFIIILFGVGVASAVCVFYKPKFSPPSGSAYQVFVVSHPITVYEKLADDFRFFRLEQTNIKLPAIYVWGVVPKDTGSVYTPKDKGELTLEKEFDLSDHNNQLWLSYMCELLKRNYTSTQTSSCSVTEYLAAVGKCDIQSDPCCCTKETPSCFKQCFPTFMARFYTAVPQEKIIGIPYFNQTNDIVALTMTFESDHEYVLDYDAIDTFYKSLSKQYEFVKKQAPEKLKHVFFTSYLLFFDTQGSFLNSAFSSAGISLAVCFLCVLVTTRNIVISIFSILNIALATLGMYACMILMDWKLNIMESLILSLALGLTIDFVIHFSVAYLLSKEKTRETKVKDVLGLVGSPAAMAAITTFVTGAAMMPVASYCYFQTGVFLMLIMVLSLVYSMFFFLSLCRFIGPLGRFGHIPTCCDGKSEETESNSSARSNKQLVNDRRFQYSGKPVFHVSRGSMYDSISDFLKTDQQNLQRTAAGNKKDTRRGTNKVKRTNRDSKKFPAYIPEPTLSSDERNARDDNNKNNRKATKKGSNQLKRTNRDTKTSPAHIPEPTISNHLRNTHEDRNKNNRKDNKKVTNKAKVTDRETRKIPAIIPMPPPLPSNERNRQESRNIDSQNIDRSRSKNSRGFLQDFKLGDQRKNMKRLVKAGKIAKRIHKVVERDPLDVFSAEVPTEEL